MIDIIFEADEPVLAPTRAHDTDAGWDLKTDRGFDLYPDEATVVNTGVKANIPNGYVGYLHVRSSLGAKYGMANAYLQAIPPTGSISYINNSTSSIHPIVSKVEIRKEGKLGRVYYPAPHMRTGNMHLFESAYDIGPEKLIDTYAVAQRWVDQGMSCTLFMRAEATTRDVDRARIYAWQKGIKTIYYIRLRQIALEGMRTGQDIDECVACAL